MMYHGLVGSSPEDQPQFRDVRVDIFDAIQKRSSVDMAIALKLPPLWWEDKLAAIIAEAHQYRDEVIASLIPPGNPLLMVPESTPLAHPDWRVRANAARILANLDVREAIPEMVPLLAVEDDSQKASFPYVAYSLAKMQTPQTRQALVKFLETEDPWLRVDAAGALAKWPLKDVSSDLMHAMLNPHPMTDYAAVAITREHKPGELLQLSSDQQEGALEVIIGLVQAAQSTFANDTTILEDLEPVLEQVARLAEEKRTPRRLRALWDLCDLLSAQSDSSEMKAHANNIRTKFSQSEYASGLLKYFKIPELRKDHEFRHAIKLAAHYQLEEAASAVIEELNPDSTYLDESIEAIASIGSADAAPHLVRLVEQLVDVDDRITRTPSKQPVFEENPVQAKSYWQALKAMGSFPQDESVSCLLKCSHDFASDKRQQALASLIDTGSNSEIKTKYGLAISGIVKNALDDPAAPVRVTALSGVQKLTLLDLIPNAVKMSGAKEASVSRQATKTLSLLAESGHATEVSTALKTSIAVEKDSFRRQRLNSLLDTVSSKLS